MEYETGSNSGKSKGDEILKGVPVKVDDEWLIAINKRDAPRPGDRVRVQTKQGKSWTTTIMALVSEQRGGNGHEPRVIVRGEPKDDRQQNLLAIADDLERDRQQVDNLLAIADDLERMAETLRGITRRK